VSAKALQAAGQPAACFYLSAKHLPQTMTQHDCPDKGSGRTGDKHRTGRDVQRRLVLVAHGLIKTAEQRFHGAIKQFSNHDKSNAADQYAPFQQVALKCNGGYDDERCREEMDEEAGLTADAELNASPRFAELVAPTTARRQRHGRLREFSAK
jgi:hypothetical protein